jgi:hypothetical protein
VGFFFFFRGGGVIFLGGAFGMVAKQIFQSSSIGLLWDVEELGKVATIEVKMIKANFFKDKKLP